MRMDVPFIQGKNMICSIEKLISFIYSLACNGEIREHQCSFDSDKPDKRSSLVTLLLCLEERLKKGSYPY